MNKILLDNIICEDNIINLEKQVKNITVGGQTLINIFNFDITSLNILVEDNSSLVVNYFNNIKNMEAKINIKVFNNSKCVFNHSFINKEQYNLEINTDFMNDYSNIKVNVHGINDRGTSNIIENGYVKENKYNNNLDECIKIMNINEGKSLSMPNMFIDSFDVSANHNNTVSNIDPNELFYFLSKGISLESAKKLICNGFLGSIISDRDLKTKIIEYLNRR